MKIGNTEIKLYYNNQAATEVSELCGGLREFGRLISDENGKALDVLEQLSNIAKLVRILANNEIRRTNLLIKMGVLGGDIKEEFTDEQFAVLLDASKLDEYFTECLQVMGLASQFIVPDEVKMTDPDYDLEELEAEKNP